MVVTSDSDSISAQNYTKIRKMKKKKIKETNNLNDMVFEANVLFLLSASVLYVEYTDEISSPASKESVENLKQDA